MSDHANDPTEARAKAHALIEQSMSDPAYRERLKTDPIATMQAAGLTLEEAEDLNSQRQDDVSGYMFCLPAHSGGCGGCDTITCLVTNCCVIPYSS